MNTTVTRPGTRAAIATAANSGTSSSPNGGCRDCVKTGLAILPVVTALAPNTLKGKSAELSALDKWLNSSDLKSHWFYMRSLPAGYLYVLKTDLTWDGYAVDSEGLLRQMPVSDLPSSAGGVTPMSQACKRSGDNIPAQVIAIDPKKHASVWMAFSRYRWTPAVLKRYAGNEGGCRDTRMLKVDLVAAASGNVGMGTKVPQGAAMSAAIGQRVADYASASTVGVLNAHLATPLRPREPQAQALATKMAEISRNTAGKTGVIIVLNDPLGNAMDLNMLRNAETAKLGAYVAGQQHKRFVGETILAFEKAFVANGQAAQWNERYKTKYKATQITTDRNAYDAKVKPWEYRLNAMSRDVALLDGRLRGSGIWHDFDAADDASAKDRQVATAACLHGAVKTREEQNNWDAWFNEDPKDPNSTLWGAVTGMNAKLGEFLVGKSLPDTGKISSFIDLGKGIKEGVEKFRAELAKRASEDAMAMLGLAMASQVTRLKAVNPSLYQVAGLKVLIVASVRTTVTATPVVVSLTRTQEALMLAEAAFGPPDAGARRLVDIERTSGKKVYVVGSNGVDAYAWRETSVTTEKVRAVELWLPDEVARQTSSGIPALTGPAARLALPPPQVNPFAALVKFTKSGPGALAWVGMTLQALNLTNSAQDMAKSGLTGETGFGMSSAILGTSGVMAEIVGGAMGKMSARFTAVAIARTAFAGGALAGLAGVAEGIQLWFKAYDRFSANDDDAGWSYVRAGGLVFLSGLAGIGGALAVASGTGALTGALSFLAGAGTAAATVPVWGWIAASVIFLGLGLALLWQAIKATDTPLEVWLLGSSYGNGTPFTPKVEMSKLNEIAYAMTIEVEWTDDDWELQNTEFYDDYDNFRFSISIPGANANSLIDCKVTLIGVKGQRQEILRESIRPKMVGGQVFDPHEIVVTAAPANRVRRQPDFLWMVPARIDSGGKEYRGELKINDSVYESAEVEIKYYPDTLNMPGLVLPAVGEQRLLSAGD